MVLFRWVQILGKRILCLIDGVKWPNKHLIRVFVGSVCVNPCTIVGEMLMATFGSWAWHGVLLRIAVLLLVTAECTWIVRSSLFPGNAAIDPSNWVVSWWSAFWRAFKLSSHVFVVFESQFEQRGWSDAYDAHMSLAYYEYAAPG